MPTSESRRPVRRIPRRACGRNSCSGGSSRRMVHGRPAIVRRRSRRNRCAVRAAAAPAPRAGPPRRRRGSSARTALIRAASKNMCSVRHRPMPSAPNWRAMRQSSGVSALVRTLHAAVLVGPFHQRAEIARQLGLDRRHLARHDLAGRAVERDDVAFLQLAAADPQRARLAGRSTRADAPDTQGRPMPRATTAAWLVIPPRAVRMPCAACMP